MGRLCVLLAAAISAVAAPAWADTQWSLRLESGAELDTNIHRLEVGEDSSRPVESAPLTRFGIRPRFRARGGHELLSFSGYAGAKLFATGDGQSENVTILQGDLAYHHLLSGRGAALGARASYYDASSYNPFDATFEVEPRTFSLAGAEATLTVAGPGHHRLIAAAGARTFRYDPDPDFDWRGDHYGLRYRTTVWRGDPDEDLDASSIELDAGYRLERRDYDGSAFTNACADDSDADPACFVPTPLGRFDLHHRLSAEAVYTGDRIYSARYELRINDSNSYGQSLVRQRLELKVTSELGSSGIYLTATGTVLLNLFLDPLLLSPDVQSQTFVSIDDENRNSLTLHLSRDLGEHWSVEARYGIYSNEFATRRLRYRRQTVYLGAVWEL